MNKLQGLHILVADDSPMNNQAVKQLLELHGAIVQTAENGQMLVDTLINQPKYFDIVLSDIEMPVMDGLQAARKVREMPQFNELPIVAISANTRPVDQWQCFKAGMNGHMAKPIQAHKLCETILSLIQCDCVSSTPSMPEKEHQLKSLILARFDNNIELVQEMLALYDAEFLKQLDLLQRSNDLLAVRAVLHGLKGLSSTIGAVEVLGQVNAISASLNDAFTTASLPNLVQKLISVHLENLAKLQSMFDCGHKQTVAMRVDKNDSDLSVQEQHKIELFLKQNDLTVISFLDQLNKDKPNDRLIEKIREVTNQLNFTHALKILQEEDDMRRNNENNLHEK